VSARLLSRTVHSWQLKVTFKREPGRVTPSGWQRRAGTTETHWPVSRRAYAFRPSLLRLGQLIGLTPEEVRLVLLRMLLLAPAREVGAEGYEGLRHAVYRAGLWGRRAAVQAKRCR
jgi:hypothetical protein